ncbi:MAG TPA: hypothetical protein VF808_16200 [Ktedonobacterales bacterium]
MIARLTNMRFPPDKLEEILRNAGGPDGVVSFVQRSPGSKGLLMLVDRAAGKSVMVTIWENEAALRDSDSARQELTATFAPLGLALTSAEVYEVVVNT